MLRPKRMKKIRLIVLKTLVGKLIKDLHEAGLLDIRQAKYQGLEEGRPLSSFDELSAELLKLRSVLSVMESAIGRKNEGQPKRMEASTALAESKSIALPDTMRKMNQEATGLGERIKALEGEALAVEKVLRFKDVDFSKLETRNLSFRIGELQSSKIQQLQGAMEKVSTNSSIITNPGDKSVLVLFDKKNSQAIDAILSDSGFDPIELPYGMNTPMETINRINMENESCKARLKEIRKEITELSKSNILLVKSLISALEQEAERAEVASKFASSKNLYIVEGWALEDSYQELRKIAGKYGSELILEDVHYGHDEIPPTVLANPSLAKPFEFLTRNYSFPQYQELDPTVPYFIGLSILYGMIVGDVLYGLFSIIFSYYIIKNFKSELLQSVAMIWLISGIPTMIFGLVYDEWGGMSHYDLAGLFTKWTGITIISAPLYHGFGRIENLSTLLLITIFVGALHLALGFILGLVNEWHHSKKHAFAKLGWLCFEIGVMTILVSQLGWLGDGNTTIATTIGGAVALVSVLLIIATEGAVGMVEIPGFAGNLLSYLRVGVIGVVGVILAAILNQYLVPLPSAGILAIILLPIFLFMHMVNAIIAMFEALVQGGRLNIFEFRTKFVHGGGDVFTPFAAYTKKI